MNTITINFVPCDPAPINGYNIQWRVFGSGGSYTDEGNFFTSPAVFTDSINPDETSYEGIIRSDCTDSGQSGTNYGNDIAWSAIFTPDDSGQVYTVYIVNLSGGGVVIEDVTGIDGFVLDNPVYGGGTKFGVHDGFTGVIGVTLSGSPISGSLSLKRNGTLLECLNIGSSGSYSFASQTFAASDVIQVMWFGGAC